MVEYLDKNIAERDKRDAHEALVENVLFPQDLQVALDLVELQY